MPRYDYRCEKHGHIFEVTQGFNDEPVAYCPEDGSRGQRQISVPHVIYKGSGFYTTDYKNSSSSNGSSKSSSNGDSSSSSSSTEGKSETKSNPKTESKASTKSESGSD